ncbi:MAG: hypothetical protein LC799_13340 [Actinobacteria bacterium]|nr:hypothetical protein [Actinomycetota bacterium]
MLREPSATVGRLDEMRRLRLRRRDAEDLVLAAVSIDNLWPVSHLQASGG